MKDFLARGSETVVAVSTEPTSINIFFGVLTIIGLLLPTMGVIAVAAHSFGIMLLVSMRASTDPYYLLDLEYIGKRVRTHIKHGFVNHGM